MRVLTKRIPALAGLLGLLAMILADMSPAHATDAAWSRLRDGGYTILIAHAQANSRQDPSGFEIDNCATQRRLSDKGRQRAQRMGARFAARAVTITKVLSSQWCIALDTARFAFSRNQAEAFEPLNLKAEGAEETVAAVVEAVAAFEDYGNLVMVTHEPNIVALTGIRPRESEALIVTPREDQEGLRVVGRIITD